MTNLPNITLNFRVPEKGFAYKVDLDLNLFLPALKKETGIELNSVAISLLLKLVRIRINDLERTIESKKILNFLSEEDELELKNQQEQEQNLVLWLNETNHG
ncbi:MAG: hypothetical protein GBAus27B_000187 [Mycoplasmataceae bacterium]|nr:MAG: hypothetical protein GBAus27B_000187 [Mycoplasmataceae bacterium]